VPSTGFTGLGGVGGFGGLSAYCETNGFSGAGITFETTEAESVFAWSNVGGLSSFTVGGSALLNVGPDAALAMATVRFISGTEVATATLTWEDNQGTCDFSVQVVDSHG
jgi:hypothetical protein